MFKCQNCKKKVPESGMKLFIEYDIVTVFRDDRDDSKSNVGITRQIRLCEKCRKLNNLEINLEEYSN